ncbi:MAG: type I restriction endonuclease subunit R [Bacteroidales bacterium]|nr:type I restriction endonuclease subunit R [Bacteroidales bacterium]
MFLFNESLLEQSVISLLEEQGYEYIKGEEIARDLDEVVLRDDLAAYLHNRYKNDGITDQEVENAIRIITQKQGGMLYAENKHTLNLLMDGFSLKREDPAKQNLYIYPIAFDETNQKHNIFKVVNQFDITEIEHRIPDVIVFVNGLPVVVFELKSATKQDTTIEDAYKQLTIRYRRDIPSLFKYTAFIVVSDGVNSKFGTLYTPYEFFYAWRKVNAKDKACDGINSLKTMIAGMFRKDRLIDVVHNFVYFPDTSKDEKKFICRYPQYFAARSLFQNILNHSKLNAGGDGKGGTYFGATGCGKSLTMLFLSRLLMKSKALCSPTIILITDRTDLDDQLSRLLLNAKQFVGDSVIEQVESREDLKAKLQGRTSGGVFLTTIQKFSKDINLLSNRANIICISDEAHRTQTNLEEKLAITEAGVKRSFGFAKYLRDSLPNATYVGFTGTPIDSTMEVFGAVVDEYSMIEAVEDGITKSILYEGRASRVIADSELIKQIEAYYDQCAEEGSSEYQIEESKRAMTQMSILLNSPDLIHRLAVDFVQHYERRVDEGSTVKGKAMIVCATREIGFAIYKEIVAMRPEWAEVRICGDGEELTKEEAEKIKPIEKIKLVCIRQKDDDPALYNLLGTDEERKKLDLQFKEEKSNFKIAIVVDMWITGFDVPCLDTMYCFKPLQMHTLIQTISRVNRNYPGKDKGLIVDYLGIKKKFNQAMKKYANGGQNETPVETIDNAVKLFKDELDLLRRMFTGFEYTKFFMGTPLEQLNALQMSAEFIQQTEETEKRFMKHTLIMKSAYNMCNNDERITREEIDDVHFFTAVRSIIYKTTTGVSPDATQMNRHVLKLVNEALISEEVVAINNLQLNDAKQIDLLASQYMEKLKNLPYKNTKVKLMEQLLKRVIDSVKKVNKVKAVSFTERLNEIIDIYNDRSDDIVLADEIVTEVAKQLADLFEEIKKDSVLPDGIPDIEVKAFYDILKSVAERYGFLDEYTEEQYIEIAQAVKEKVDDSSQFIDWDKRADIKAQLKVQIILTLSKHGYPPATRDEVFKAIFEQAENFKKNRIDEPSPVIHLYSTHEEKLPKAAEDRAPYGTDKDNASIDDLLK